MTHFSLFNPVGVRISVLYIRITLTDISCQQSDSRTCQILCFPPKKTSRKCLLGERLPHNENLPLHRCYAFLWERMALYPWCSLRRVILLSAPGCGISTGYLGSHRLPSSISPQQAPTLTPLVSLFLGQRSLPRRFRFQVLSGGLRPS